MRVGAFFNACMAAIGIGVVVLGTLLGMTAWRDWAASREASAALAVLDGMLRLKEVVGLERAPVINALNADTALTDAGRAALEKGRGSVNQRLATVIATLQDLNYPWRDRVMTSMRTLERDLAAVRRRVDDVAAVPRSARQQSDVVDINATLTALAAAPEPLIADMDHRIGHSAPDVATASRVAVLAAEARNLGGSRAALYSSVMAARRVLTPAEIATAERFQGQVEALRRQIVALVDVTPADSAVRGGLAAAQAGYFTKGLQLLEQAAQAGRTDGAYPLPVADFISQMVAQLNSLVALRDKALSMAAQDVEAMQVTAHRDALMLAALVAGLLIGGAALSWLFRRRVVGPLVAQTSIIGRLAAGERGLAIAQTDRRDEIGQLAQSIDVLQKNAEQADQLAEAQRQEEQIKAERAARIAQYSSQFDQESRSTLDAVGGLTAEMRSQSDRTSDMMRQANDEAKAVAEAADRARQNIETVASAAEELTASIREIGDRVEGSAQVAGTAVAQVSTANQQIMSLADATQRIGAIVQMISDIAAQTNLLALNATIEAARAGDSGKGFAVVASEVKQLASRTAKATEEIQGQIQAIQGSVEGAVDKVQGVTETIQDIDRIISGIAASIEQQSAATQEIARNMMEAADGTRSVAYRIQTVETSLETTELAAATTQTSAGRLSERTQHLIDAINLFLGRVKAA